MLKDILTPFNLQKSQIQKLEAYLDLLAEANKSINLVSRKMTREELEVHIFDSLAVLKAIDFKHGDRIIDIGSGGGFPAIPLGIALPEIKLVLVESTQKKAAFLESVKDRLGLINLKVVAKRAEEINKSPDYRGRFNYVTARAVTSLRKLIEYSSAFLKEGGELLAYKSVNFQSEVDNWEETARRFSMKFEGIFEYELPVGFGRRIILKLQKSL